MDACMTSVQHVLTNIFENFGCFVDGSRNEGDSCLQIRFRICGRAVHSALHSTERKYSRGVNLVGRGGGGRKSRGRGGVCDGITTPNPTIFKCPVQRITYAPCVMKWRPTLLKKKKKNPRQFCLGTSVRISKRTSWINSRLERPVEEVRCVSPLNCPPRYPSIHCVACSSWSGSARFPEVIHDDCTQILFMLAYFPLGWLKNIHYLIWSLFWYNLNTQNLPIAQFFFLFGLLLAVTESFIF